jgi:tRNA pseudouridine55 synthase
MATGVLVLAIGEGTKLVPYLTGQSKAYEAEVTLGRATTTLDALGETTAEAEVPRIDTAGVAAACALFVGELRQRVPDVSAVRLGGERLYEKVRRGTPVDAPERTVVVHGIEVREVAGAQIRLHVRCGKGFYVRALARDLAEALSTVGHLSRLQRLSSGPFDLHGATPTALVADAARGDAAAAEAVHGAVRSLRDAWSGGSMVLLNDQGTADAQHGRPVVAEGCARGTLPVMAEEETAALVGVDGCMVALARRQGDVLRVVRGFRRREA